MKKFTIVLAIVFLYTMPTICSDNEDYAADYNTNDNTPEAQVDGEGMINNKRVEPASLYSDRKNSGTKSKNAHGKARINAASKKNSSKKSKNSHGKAKVQSMNDDSKKHSDMKRHDHHEDRGQSIHDGYKHTMNHSDMKHQGRPMDHDQSMNAHSKKHNDMKHAPKKKSDMKSKNLHTNRHARRHHDKDIVVQARERGSM